jgi:hypothetical protein
MDEDEQRYEALKASWLALYPGLQIDPDDVDPAFVEFLDDAGCYGPGSLDLDDAEEYVRECEEPATGRTPPSNNPALVSRSALD